MKPEKIYVVFKTHVDLGFTDLPSGVVRQYKEKMMDDVLNVCEATANHPPGRRYVWTLPAWMLIQCLDEADPQRRERLDKLVRDGQLCWHGLPFTTHTEFCGVEEYLRGLYWSESLNRKYGKEVISAKMTDVPGHTWMLPSLLRQAGIQFLHLGVNSCSAPVHLPRLFWWEGPDGARVLTWYSPGEYGTSLLPPEDWKYPVWLALMQTHDNIGPQSSEIVQELLDEVAAKYPDAEVHLGTMDDFARDFLSRSYDDIPVIRKDLADTWIHGVGTYPAEVSRVRQLRYDLAAAESFHAMRAEHGLEYVDEASQVRAAITKGYEQTLLFGEHTWGIDIKSNLLPGRHNRRAFWAEDLAKDRARFPETYAKVEQSWEEQREYVRAAARQAAEALEAPAAGGPVTVYNPLPRARAASTVRLGETWNNGSLIDTVTNQRYRVSGNGEAVIGPIGPLESRSFRWEADPDAEDAEQPFSACSGSEATIENEAIRVRVDVETGRIISLFDKRANKEWAGAVAFGTYRYDVFGKEEIMKFVKDYAYDLTDWYINDFFKPGYPRIPSRTFPSAAARLVEERNAGGRQQIRILYDTDPDSRGEFGNAASAELTITLGSCEGVDFELRLLGKKETAFAEAGFFVLPLQADRPQYRLQKMGAVVDPLSDIERGANCRLHCLDQWIDVQEEGGAGLAVFSLDAPLCSLGEPGIFKYEEEYRPQSPTLYFNLFNNQWGTNFPQWIGGDFTYRFRLLPHAGNWKQARLEAAAEELRHPLRAAACEAELPTILAESLEDVRWLAVKRAENGEEATIIRWMNATDETKETKLSFTREYSRIVRCTAVEREIENLAADSRSVTLTVRPFEIMTLKLCR